MTAGDERTVLACDIGGTKIATGLVVFGADSQAVPQVREVRSIPTLASEGGASVLARLADLVAERVHEANEVGIEVAGVGIGSAGVVDSAAGAIVSATDLMPGWAGQQVVSSLRERVDLPMAMVGDVGAHGLGEALYGAGRGFASVLSVGVGTGIGGSLVEGGQIVTGAHGVAGHVGHMPHPLGVGFTCSCGTLSGHIEPVASGTGLATLYNRWLETRAAEFELSAATSPVQGGAAVVERLAAGDALAHAVVEASARALGQSIAGMGNLMDPAVIVLSGSVVNAGELWWSALKQGFAEAALPLVARTPLVTAQLGGNAPLVGAASALLRSLEQPE